MNDKKLLLIDGNSIMNRGYFALPMNLTNDKGLHTNAILGFLNIFFKIYDEEKPTNIIVAFDVHKPTFRHEMYKEYKGTRHAMDPELREQFPVIKDILRKMNILTVEKAGYEADDILGTYSRKAYNDMAVTIITGDRDLLQLATENVLIRIPKTKSGNTIVENYNAKDVVKLYGVTPEEFIEMKGLMGDSSDNIPGVPGIGPKTASKIIEQYHSVENAILHVDEIKPNKASQNLKMYSEQALFSRDLSRIKLDCELDEAVENSAVSKEQILGIDTYNTYKELGLNSLLKRLDFSDKNKLSQSSCSINIFNLNENKDESCNTISDDTFSIQEEKKNIQNKNVKKLVIKKIDTLNDILFSGNIIGIEPAVSNEGILFGTCIYDNGNAYIYTIHNENDKDALVDFLHNGFKYAFLSFKPYIDMFEIKKSDKVFDAELLSYLADPTAGSYSYESIAKRNLDEILPSEIDLIGKSEVTIFSIDDENYEQLIAEKAYVASEATKKLMELLNLLGETKLYWEIEHPLEFVLYEMEKTGIRCDENILTEYGKKLKTQISEIETEIYEIAGEKFNILSTKQLGVILFDKLGLKSGKKKKNGYSTSVDVLNKIKDDNPIVNLVLLYRQLNKLLSTYVDGLIQSISADGRIHSKFNQTVTATGRISSTEPNLQNIPTRTELGRELRKAFVPDDGYLFVDADYSQIELRVMASISDDENLIEAFHDGKDIHAITASKVFGVPIDKVSSDLRRKAKAVNFGIIYGISSFGLGEDLHISRKEAGEYINKYFENYQGVKKYLDKQVEDAKQNGRTQTMFGRIRPIPEINSSNFMQRSFGERVAMNAPIQGTAADIMKIAMIKVDEALKSYNLRSRLVLQIHDELLIETAQGEEEIVREILTKYMQNAVELAVPFYIDIHSGENMFDVK